MIVRRPPIKQRTEGGIIVDVMDQRRQHGLIMSMGAEAERVLGDKRGLYVVFDPNGEIPIQVDPVNKSSFVALDYSQALCCMTRDEVIAAKGEVFEE